VFRSDELEANPAAAQATQHLRDWWCSSVCGDGDAPTDEEMMAAIDQWWPMPVPPPLCGQVWLRPAVGDAHAITYVCAIGEAAWDVSGLWTEALVGLTPLPYGEGGSVWPPHKAVLAAGPGSPWAPRDTNEPTQEDAGGVADPSVDPGVP